MKKISVIIAQRHLTSITLEEPFYQVLKELAEENKLTVNGIVTQIDKSRGEENLSSAVRIFILRQLLEKINSSKKIL